jgi:hypothetical protein
VRDPAAAARGSLLDSHAEFLADVCDCADAVAETWEDPPTDRRQVVEPLTALLRQRGLLAEFPAMLASAVEAAGYRMRATPVPAPPYVVVASTGPVCRATVSDGRLVVRLACFTVDRRGQTPRYVRSGTTPADALSVEFRT